MQFKLWLCIPVGFAFFVAALSLAQVAAADTNANSANLRLELQKSHDARLAFERERKSPAINHGLYEDFRAVFVPVEGHLTHGVEEQLIAAALKSRIQVIFLAVRGKGTEQLQGPHPGVLIIRGNQSDELLSFADIGSKDAELKFRRHPEVHAHQSDAALLGMEIWTSSSEPKVSAQLAPATNDPAFRQLIQAFPAEAFAPRSFPRQSLTKSEQTERALIGIGVNDIGPTPLTL